MTELKEYVDVSIVIPITFSSFTRNLRKCSVQEGRDE